MKRMIIISVVAALVAWLIAVIALRQFMPCDPMLQLEGRLPEFFRCVIERRYGN